MSSEQRTPSSERLAEPEVLSLPIEYQTGDESRIHLESISSFGNENNATSVPGLGRNVPNNEFFVDTNEFSPQSLGHFVAEDPIYLWTPGEVSSPRSDRFVGTSGCQHNPNTMLYTHTEPPAASSSTLPNLSCAQYTRISPISSSSTPNSVSAPWLVPQVPDSPSYRSSTDQLSPVESMPWSCRTSNQIDQAHMSTPCSPLKGPYYSPQGGCCMSNTHASPMSISTPDQSRFRKSWPAHIPAWDSSIRSERNWATSYALHSSATSINSGSVGGLGEANRTTLDSPTSSIVEDNSSPTLFDGSSHTTGVTNNMNLGLHTIIEPEVPQGQDLRSDRGTHVGNYQSLAQEQTSSCSPSVSQGQIVMHITPCQKPVCQATVAASRRRKSQGPSVSGKHFLVETENDMIECGCGTHFHGKRKVARSNGLRHVRSFTTRLLCGKGCGTFFSRSDNRKTHELTCPGIPPRCLRCEDPNN